MKKVSYMVLFIALAVVVLLILSPRTSGRSDNPCSSGPGCHGSQYYQYLDILEGNSASQIPSAIEVGETKTVSVVVENTGNPGSYATLSGVSVTLTSKNGYFSVSSPTYSIGDLPLGKKTATFQITGVSEGFDSLSIAARGDNKQHLVALTFSFSDSYSSSITVGHPAPTPTPPPANTPTPTLTPSPTVTPTVPTPTPSTSTPNPEATPTPAPTNQLAVQLMSPSNGEQWAAGTMRSIIWNTNGGTDPLTITLEYSVISIDGPWVAIATGMPNNGSLAWKTPDTASTVYIRAVITDSANPPQTASTISSVEITGANVEFPLILIPAMLIPAIAMLTVLFKRRRTKGNNASKLKAPVNLHVKSESLKRF